ncbi:TetR/AcrR family transcriptional regulator [Actinomadura flavalba]|uniref:TetR/AcrR family transcriptional regulator n=1 Tax=Actinomadura flavalba TaxID=1120938 RepID=UPI00035F379E|nr:TetR/AcrR family transcriptional regulator [Actinomadura flavalba]
MTTDTSTPPGLRESKKQETRQAISDHATRLFVEQGFEATTISEIAAAARVAKKTVTNYFARKEDLALDHQDAFAASLARVVSGRAPGESAPAALRRAFAAAVEARDPVAGFAPEPFARMIADSPTLTAALRVLHDRREAELARALADATGAAPDDITVLTTATLLGGVHRVLFQRIQDHILAGRSADETARLVAADAARAFDLVEPALA